MKRISMLCLVILMITSACQQPTTRQTTADGPLTFIMFGDTRTESYIPYGQDSLPAVEQILRMRYAHDSIRIVFSDKALVDTVFVSKGDQLSKVLIYNGEKFPVQILAHEKDSMRQIFCKEGLDWVYNSVAHEVNSGSRFAIHGGDIVLNGSQGNTYENNPYWTHFRTEFYDKIEPDQLYPVVGNHETWMDDSISMFTQAFEHLKALGFSPDHRIYSRDVNQSKFIALYSGTYSDSTEWNAQEPDFNKQMKYLDNQLQEAIKSGMKNVFVTYHFPSFVKVGHDPLPPSQNPHEVLKKYAKQLNVMVFNSHTHTTEYYIVDSVRYLVMGGGGAPQKFTNAPKPTTEHELYWNGVPRYEEYNYLKVIVEKDQIVGMVKKFTPPAKTDSLTLFEFPI